MSASARHPHVLLTNDDGIEAPGLRALADAMREVADVTIVAPDSERSATGHSISIHKDLYLEPREENGELWGWGLAGTPADCVKVAHLMLCRERPIDVVVSGINAGQNVGVNIIYSGTVGAAREATLCGLPGIAVSQYYRDPEVLPYETAARVAVEALDLVRRNGLPPGVMLNVNVPPVPYAELRGWAVARMSQAGYIDFFQQIPAVNGRPGSFRNVGDGWSFSAQDADDWDDLALEANQVTLTPLTVDLTAHEHLELLRGWLADR